MTTWWESLTSWVASGSPTLIAATLSAIAPLTAHVVAKAAIKREGEQHKHQVEKEHLDQEHQIVSSYLDRALNPETPLAIRQQLLRFLSTPGSGASKLEGWAGAELKLVDRRLLEYDVAVNEAEKRMRAAKTNLELQTAQQELQIAHAVRETASEKARQPPPTVAAFRAGMLVYKEIGAVDLSGLDLDDCRFQGNKMRGANLSNTTMQVGSFFGCDLRFANLSGSAFGGAVSFREADLRGANLRDTVFRTANVSQARMEGADMTGASIAASQFNVCYDSLTKWPEDVDPVQLGAVKVDG
ncbi:MAG: pentapeptide repeat-containing protein [Myxococcota bacterium]